MQRRLAQRRLVGLRIFRYTQTLLKFRMKALLVFVFSDFEINGQGTKSNTQKYRKKCTEEYPTGKPSQYLSSSLFLELLHQSKTKSIYKMLDLNCSQKTTNHQKTSQTI